MSASRTFAAIPKLSEERAQRWLPRILSFPVFLGAMLVFAVFVCVRTSAYDPDTWWHIAVGNHILTTHSWPTTDRYSFTAFGNPWIAYEWLGALVIALATQLGGLVGQKVLLVALGGAFVLLLYQYATLVCRNSKAAFVACAIILAPAGLFFTLRPQLIGYIFLLILLVCLELFRQGKKKAIWFLPLLFLFWANTHGSFAFGFLVLAVWWLSGLAEFRIGGLETTAWTGWERLQLELAGLLSLLATFCTPYGTQLFCYPLEMAMLQPLNVATISEWQSLNPSLTIGKWFLGFLLVLLLAEILLRPIHRLDGLALLLISIVIASLHRRFLVVFIVVFTPWLAVLISRWVPPYRREADKPFLNGLLILAGVVGLVVFFPTRQTLQQGIGKNYPVAAVDYLKSHPVPGPMLNEYGWGGYLIYTRSPGHKVFIDGRADIYEYSGVLADYRDMTRLRPDTLFLLRKDGIRACLLRRRAPLRNFLAALPDWKIVYEDELSTILVRHSSAAALRTITASGSALQAFSAAQR